MDLKDLIITLIKALEQFSVFNFDNMCNSHYNCVKTIQRLSRNQITRNWVHMSFFYVENCSFWLNHLLPTTVGTIMKNNHIIVGLGLSCCFRPTDFTTIQRLQLFPPPTCFSIGLKWLTWDLGAGFYPLPHRFGWDLPVKPHASVDFLALHF